MGKMRASTRYRKYGCLGCGIKTDHHGLGYCEPCYLKLPQVIERKKQFLQSEVYRESLKKYRNSDKYKKAYLLKYPDSKRFERDPNRWAWDWDFCKECGKTDIPHLAYGLCGPCYSKIHEKEPEVIAKRKISQAKYRNSEKYKARRKIYYQIPEVKARIKIYHKTSLKFKASQAKYQQTEKYKAKMKIYHQSPEYKAKKKEYQKKYRRSQEVLNG